MEITEDPRALAKELGAAADAPVGPYVGVATIALNMAMKYHDINTVQDGVLYQQYKMEGRNMHELHIDAVFETAMQIEVHLIKANKRIALALMADLADIVADDDAADGPAPTTDQPKA